MNYCVVLSQMDDPAKVVHCPNDSEGLLQVCYQLIGCGCRTVQLVPQMEGRLPEGYEALCDEDRYGKTLFINPLASWIYGADEHGAAIVGNSVILKVVETEDGADLAFMTEDEAQTVADELNKDLETKYDLVVFKVMTALMKE